MQHTLTFPPAQPPELESNTPFNVLIAYEDFETGKQAKQTYDFLAENLGKECQLTNQMWKFDVLSIPKLREIAVRDAMAADIILISCYGDQLPAHVTKWIESWLMEGTHALALVVLFHRPDAQLGGTSPMRDYFVDVAKRGHLEFFAQPNDWPGRCQATDPFFLHRRLVAAERKLTTLAGAFQRDVTPRWGINE